MREKSAKQPGGKVSSRLENLFRVNQYLAEIESLEQLLPHMMELARNVTEAQAASVLLYNPHNNLLEFSAISDEQLDPDHVKLLKKKVKIEIGRGITGAVAKSRKPLILKDVQSDPRFLRLTDSITGFKTRNILSVPLVYDDDLLGVLNVLNAKTKPCFDREDQKILLSYAHLASTAIIRAKLIETRLRQQRLEVELATAAKLQALFWPANPELGSGNHAWAISVPAASVGGDLYDFLPVGDGSWIVYVADVADKGLPAAMIMVALWSKIRSEVSLHADIETLLGIINNSMYELFEKETYFATIVLGRYWPGSGRFDLVRGGHPPPLWISDGKPRDLPSLDGISLGVVKDARYTKQSVSILPGDSMLFFSDGVTESTNEKLECFGTSRLLDTIRQLSGPPWSRKVLSTVKTWRKSAEQSDDITILEIWRDSC